VSTAGQAREATVTQQAVTLRHPAAVVPDGHHAAGRAARDGHAGPVADGRPAGRDVTAAADPSRLVARLAEPFERGLTSPIFLTWELTYACSLAFVHGSQVLHRTAAERPRMRPSSRAGRTAAGRPGRPARTGPVPVIIGPAPFPPARRARRHRPPGPATPTRSPALVLKPARTSTTCWTQHTQRKG